MKRRFNTTKSISLIELLISIIIVTMMVLSFYSLQTFSQGQVVNSQRRSKVQSELAYALEHMSKYVQQANGGKNYHQAIGLYPPAGIPFFTGFQTWVDFRSPQIPSDLDNGAWVIYSLDSSTHILSTNCSVSGTGTCGSLTLETLSNKIIGHFVANAIMPNNPGNGFYVKLGPNLSNDINVVEIALVGRYNPSSPPSLTNPQVEMKTKIICNNSSTN